MSPRIFNSRAAQRPKLPRDGRLKFRRAYPSDGHLVPRHHDLLARLDYHVPEHLEAVVPELPRPDGPNANPRPRKGGGTDSSLM